MSKQVYQELDPAPMSKKVVCFSFDTFGVIDEYLVCSLMRETEPSGSFSGEMVLIEPKFLFRITLAVSRITCNQSIVSNASGPFHRTLSIGGQHQDGPRSPLSPTFEDLIGAGNSSISRLARSCISFTISSPRINHS
jgi:hypothetical protein